MCQSYQGYGTRASGSSTIVKVEDPRTDRAVLETAHQVRRHGNGRIARTEFSTSSGGWTLGGEFPAVRDDGDAYAGNAHHSWTVTLTRERIEAAFDARQGRDMGTWTGFDGYVRDGQGDLGGRVTTVRARFTGGDVTLTGDQMRFLFGLKSSWFATSP
jgi:peptidoglycan hydrolase-like amidase